jgi:hypothetical protein
MYAEPTTLSMCTIKQGAIHTQLIQHTCTCAQTLAQDFAELATAFLDDIIEPHDHRSSHTTLGEHGSTHLHALSAAPRQQPPGGIRNRDHDHHAHEHDDWDDYDADGYKKPANKPRPASVSFGGKHAVFTGLSGHVKNDRVAATQGGAHADVHEVNRQGPARRCERT